MTTMATTSIAEKFGLLGLVTAVLMATAVSAQADPGPSSPPGEMEIHEDEEESTGIEEQEGIEIDVRVGASRVLVPMGVPDTIRGDDEVDSVANDVEEILRRNLELAGYFDLLDPGSFFFDTDEEGMSVADIGFSNWFNVGAQGLVKSEVRRASSEEVELDLRLFAVEQGQQIELDWSATTVDEGAIRAEINAFINEVVRHYTGNPGFFGSQIAFSRRHDARTKHIYRANADGSGVERISRSDNINLVPTFAKDGRIFFTDYRDGNPDLYVYDDGDYRRLSDTQGQNTGAAYCDGKVAVTMSRATTQTDIYLIDPESGSMDKRLTDHWAIDVSPTWSPDCSQIAFVSGRSGGAHIFLMDPDGEDTRRLTFRGSYNTTPDWSPRGDRIVFSGRDEYARFDIFTVDMDGNIERLTQDQGDNFEPVFSPDGRYILFVSDREDGRQLWLMTADGQMQTRLTQSGSGYEEPAWRR